MKERVKVFHYLSGEGSTGAGSGLEELINEWLASVDGTFLRVSQSESQRPGAAQHITVCIWYIAE